MLKLGKMKGIVLTVLRIGRWALGSRDSAELDTDEVCQNPRLLIGSWTFA